MHFFTRNALLLHNCAAELLVKVLKLFETVIYLLVYRKCFKWRKKNKKKRIISEEHFSLAAKQGEEGSFIHSWMAPISQAAPSRMKAAPLEEMQFPIRETPRSKPWDSCLGLENSKSWIWPSLANTGGHRSPRQPRHPSLTPAFALGARSQARHGGEWCPSCAERRPSCPECCPSSCTTCTALPRVMAPLPQGAL